MLNKQHMHRICLSLQAAHTDVENGCFMRIWKIANGYVASVYIPIAMNHPDGN